MIDYPLIGARMKSARERQKITQEALAEQVGITVVYLSKIENGRVHPTLEVLHALCVALHMELSQIFADCTSDSPAYQLDAVQRLFQSLSPDVKPVALDLLKDLSKLH